MFIENNVQMMQFVLCFWVFFFRGGKEDSNLIVIISSQWSTESESTIIDKMPKNNKCFSIFFNSKPKQKQKR